MAQPITDQQSKVFSNQIPSNAIQSLEVIEGAPPAQYGDKTSLVIVATTRSGLGITKPTGDLYSSYGTFGSADGGFDLSYGGQNWGNFVELDGLNTGRFLDPPEFTVFHSKGNEENFFDRVDYSFTRADSIHLDLNYSRSWFQTPNAFQNLNVQNVINGTGASASPVFGNVGNTDQGSKINTFNVSPTYTRIISNNSVLNLTAFARRDDYDYFPSANPLADLGPSNLQTSSISQYRTLTNAGTHADYTWVHGRQNLLAGIQYEQTFLREHDSLGIVDNTYNAPCVDLNGNSLPGYSDPSQCNGVTNEPNAEYLTVLAPYDLTRGGAEYTHFGHTDVKELALYIEDQIKAGNWNFNLGIRGDMYNGLAIERQAEPRLGVAYKVKPTATVLALSYARTLETPFNENLVLSSEGCADPVLAPLLLCTPGVQGILQPGFRNEFHASVQQAFGQHLVVSGEYIWKYTHNAFDFSVLGNTPITFPIDWRNSKIPGYALHAEVPNFHGFSAYIDASSVAARFFPPQVAGAGATVGQSRTTVPHRPRRKVQPDHPPPVHAPPRWLVGRPLGRFQLALRLGLRWPAPCLAITTPAIRTAACGAFTAPGGQPGVDLSRLTPDEQFEAGITCDGVAATPATGFTSCDAAGYNSKLVQIPAPEHREQRPQSAAHRAA